MTGFKKLLLAFTVFGASTAAIRFQRQFRQPYLWADQRQDQKVPRLER